MTWCLLLGTGPASEMLQPALIHVAWLGVLEAKGPQFDSWSGYMLGLWV